MRLKALPVFLFLFFPIYLLQAAEEDKGSVFSKDFYSKKSDATVSQVPKSSIYDIKNKNTPVSTSNSVPDVTSEQNPKNLSAPTQELNIIKETQQIPGRYKLNQPVNSQSGSVSLDGNKNRNTQTPSYMPPVNRDNEGSLYIEKFQELTDNKLPLNFQRKSAYNNSEMYFTGSLRYAPISYLRGSLEGDLTQTFNIPSNNFGLDFGLGHRPDFLQKFLDPNFRLEYNLGISLSRFKAKEKDSSQVPVQQSLSLVTPSVKIFYDFNKDKEVQLFVGTELGLSYAIFKNNIRNQKSETASGIIPTVGLNIGANYDIRQNLKAGFSYGYMLALGTLGVKSNTSSQPESSDIIPPRYKIRFSVHPIRFTLIHFF